MGTYQAKTVAFWLISAGESDFYSTDNLGWGFAAIPNRRIHSRKNNVEDHQKAVVLSQRD